MPKGRVGIIHGRKSMHESGRSQRRFTRITKMKIRAQIDIELLRIRNGKFIEQIVRMLSIVQRLIVPRLAALKQKGITAPAFSERIEAHHQSPAELHVVINRM